MVLKDQKMLEKAFEPYGTRVTWHTITSGAKQAQAMAAGSIDVSAVMNTASLLMANGAGTTVYIARRCGAPDRHLCDRGSQGKDALSSKTSRARRSQAPAAPCYISFSWRP